MDPLLKKVIFRFFVLLLCIFFSAWLFFMAEHTEKDSVEEKYPLLLSLYELMTSKCNMTIEEFNNFTSLALQALSERKPRWTYVAAVDFVFQAFTTVGYGYITPQTPTGQLLCIFVCLLGIPITLLTLKAIGELIAKFVGEIIIRFEKKILKREEPKQVQTKSAVILFSLMVAILFLYTAYSMFSRDWTVVEGVYFWFITLTTVGFGDYIPHKIPLQSIKLINTSEFNVNKDEPVDTEDFTTLFFFDVFFIVECMLGLCVVSSVLNSIMAALEERKCHPRCPRCVPRNRQSHPQNNELDKAQEQREPRMTAHFRMENAGFQMESMGSVSLNEIN